MTLTAETESDASQGAVAERVRKIREAQNTGVSRAEGLPLGLQLAAPAFAEATLLRAAAGYERAAPWREMAPVL